MNSFERASLHINMDGMTRVLWWFGWNAAARNALLVGMALMGLIVLKHPMGLALGLVCLVPWWKAITLINTSWKEYLNQAESFVREQGAGRLGVTLEGAECAVLRAGRGKTPLAVTPNPQYSISVVYICDVFFAVYQGAVFDLNRLDIELPSQGEEVYFRHVSAVNYSPPNIEVIISNGKAMRKFEVGIEGGGAVLGKLRAKLRATSHTPASVTQRAESRSETQIKPTGQETNRPVESFQIVAGCEGTSEDRHCYLRADKLRQLLSDPSVLDVLVEQLEVPGGEKTLKQLSPQEKMQCIETQIEHFRRTSTSVWYGVPTLEVLAASIWRASDDPFYRKKGLLTEKLVRREWFCGVSDEDDLRIPVAKWLKSKGYEPYMEIPMGSARVDVLGYMKPHLSGSERLTAVELKNDYEQFKRALNQMSTFGEYTNAVYMACTPAFAAGYLDHNEQSTDHWDREVLERKLTGGGFGLLIVEKEQVFEVVKPVERTPLDTKFLKVTGALSSVNLINW